MKSVLLVIQVKTEGIYVICSPNCQYVFSIQNFIFNTQYFYVLSELNQVWITGFPKVDDARLLECRFSDLCSLGSG
jgi:hypothetical protein